MNHIQILFMFSMCMGSQPGSTRQGNKCAGITCIRRQEAQETFASSDQFPVKEMSYLSLVNCLTMDQQDAHIHHALLT